LYKFSLTYSDEKFMKGVFFNDNHVTYVLFCVWTFMMTFVVFYVIGPNFHYVSIHQHQNDVYKVKFFQKYLKL